MTTCTKHASLRFGSALFGGRAAQAEEAAAHQAMLVYKARVAVLSFRFLSLKACMRNLRRMHTFSSCVFQDEAAALEAMFRRFRWFSKQQSIGNATTGLISFVGGKIAWHAPGSLRVLHQRGQTKTKIAWI